MLYEKLEYIESTGTQYIDTGYKPTQNTFGFLLDVSWTDISITWGFGSRKANSQSEGSSSVIMLSNGGLRKDWQLSGDNYMNIQSGVRYVIEGTPNMFIVDGVVMSSITNRTYGTQLAYSVSVFGVNTAGTTTLIGKSRVYRCILKEGSTIVRNLIPVRRLSDGAVGMLDLASETFYGNSGTGEFVAGDPIRERYLDKVGLNTLWNYVKSLVSSAVSVIVGSLNQHKEDTTVHVTEDEKEEWNEAYTNRLTEQRRDCVNASKMISDREFATFGSGNKVLGRWFFKKVAPYGTSGISYSYFFDHYVTKILADGSEASEDVVKALMDTLKLMHGYVADIPLMWSISKEMINGGYEKGWSIYNNIKTDANDCFPKGKILTESYSVTESFSCPSNSSNTPDANYYWNITSSMYRIGTSYDQFRCSQIAVAVASSNPNLVYVRSGKGQHSNNELQFTWGNWLLIVNSDENVKQTLTSSNTYRKLMLSYGSSSTNGTIDNNQTKQTYYATDLGYNPSQGILKVPIINEKTTIVSGISHSDTSQYLNSTRSWVKVVSVQFASVNPVEPCEVSVKSRYANWIVFFRKESTKMTYVSYIEYTYRNTNLRDKVCYTYDSTTRVFDLYFSLEAYDKPLVDRVFISAYTKATASFPFTNTESTTAPDGSVYATRAYINPT